MLGRLLGKETKLETKKEGRCWGRRQGWDQTRRVGNSDVEGSGDGKGLVQELCVSGSQKEKGAVYVASPLRYEESPGEERECLSACSLSLCRECIGGKASDDREISRKG